MNAKKMIYCAIFTAFGIIVPQILHFTGGPMLGSVFLPMHLPVIAAGFLCGPVVGTITGIFSPILSSALTGMPPVPRLWFMIIELSVYGWTAGMLYFKYKKNIYIALLVAMIFGRSIYGVVHILAVQLFGITLPSSFGVMAVILKGTPGIILQIIVLPVIVIILERYTRINDIRNIETKS